MVMSGYLLRVFFCCAIGSLFHCTLGASDSGAALLSKSHAHVLAVVSILMAAQSIPVQAIESQEKHAAENSEEQHLGLEWLAGNRRRRFSLSLSGFGTRRRQATPAPTPAPTPSICPDGASSLVPSYKWGLPPTCDETKSLGVCTDDDEDLRLLRVGLHAEIFAAVASSGTAKASDGNLYSMSAEALRLAGIIKTEVATNLEAHLFDSNGNSDMTIRNIANSGQNLLNSQGTAQSDCATVTSQYPHYAGQSSVALDPQEAQAIVFQGVYIKEYREGVKTFNSIWSSAVRETFQQTSDDCDRILHDYVAPSGNCDIGQGSLNIYIKMVGGDSHHRFRNIPNYNIHCGEYDHPQLPNDFPYKGKKKCFTIRGGHYILGDKFSAVIDGLEWTVLSANQLKIRQGYRVGLHADPNKGCCPGKWLQSDGTLTKDPAGPTPWKTDDEYGCESQLEWNLDLCEGCCCDVSGMAGLTSGSLSHSLTADSSGNSCKSWFLRMDKVFRTYQALLRASMLARKASCCSDWTEANADFDAAWEAGSDQVCDNEKTPSPPAPTPGTPSFSGFPAVTGYTDITSSHISKLHMSCNEHMYAAGQYPHTDLLRGEWQWGPTVGGREDKYGLALKHLSKDLFVERIVCAEDTYPIAAQFIFSPMMGQKYMSPRIEQHSSRSGALKISCGGHEQRVYGYGGMFTFSTNAENAVGWDGQNVHNSLQTARLDGGLWKTGQYRPLVGGKSTTCCPPLNFASKSYGAKTSPDVAVSDNSGANDYACDRNLFGDTSRCEADFDLQILECNGCCCTNDQGKAELVKVNTRNSLLDTVTGSTPACNGWFTMVDAGVRALIGKVREEVMQAKAESCKAAQCN
jgi:hypothetical protein